jgi:hypothetical protein
LNNKYLIGDAYCRVDTTREINNVGGTYSEYQFGKIALK